MMDALHNKAEFLIENGHKTLAQRRIEVLAGNGLYAKLADLYAQEAARDVIVNHLCFTNKILEKLVKQENLNCLIINLYKGNDGYSIAVKTNNMGEIETVKLKYEDDGFLQYLDNEQLPPMLLDLIDESKIDLYYSGCIIADIRDYRRCIEPNYESRYVMLKPSNQSIVADVEAISRGKNWTLEEKLELESQIVKKSAPPLNLAPSMLIGIVNNKLHQHKYKFSAVPLKRAARRHTQVAQNRIKAHSERPRRSQKLMEIFQNKNKKNILNPSPKQAPAAATKEMEAKDCYDLLRQQEEMQKFSDKVLGDIMCILDAKEAERIKLENEERLEAPSSPLPVLEDHDCSLVINSEHIMETERSQGVIYYTKLKLYQRVAEETVYGELYVDREYKEGKQPTGSTCSFKLGSKDQVAKYLSQFREILTEEGRKTVKVTTKFPGKKTQVEVIPKGRIFKESLSKIDSHAQSIHSTEGDNALKTQINVMGKAPTQTIPGVISGQQIQQQQIVGQPMVVGRGTNIANIVNARSVVGGVSQNLNTIPTASIPASSAKVAVNVQAGGPKFSLPMLTAQLNRPAPSYSQAVKAQQNRPQGTVLIENTPKQIKADTSSSTLSANSNLQALLAGTPSADNPSPHSKGSTLLERLSAQSIGLNSMKVAKPSSGEDDSSLKTEPILNTAPSSGSITLRNDAPSTVPQNINIANIANLQGLNVNIPNLQTLQNVQVSIASLSTPISFTINSVPSSSSAVIVSSPLPSNNVGKSGITSVASSGTTVMIASQSGLQQGQVVQFGQFNGSQLAAHLSKPTNQTGTTQSTIPVLQVQGVGNQMFTSLQRVSGAPISATSQPVSIAPSSQILTTAVSDGAIPITQTSGPSGSSIVTLTSKQPVQLAMSKQPAVLTWQLHQKLIAAKRQQMQQNQNQQPK